MCMLRCWYIVTPTQLIKVNIRMAISTHVFVTQQYSDFWRLTVNLCDNATNQTQYQNNHRGQNEGTQYNFTLCMYTTVPA